MWRTVIVFVLLSVPCAFTQTIISPVESYEYSSGVGSRMGGGNSQNFHKGIDIPVPVGTLVRSVARGTIVENWPAPNDYYRGHPVFGGYVIVYHGRGIYSAYAHLSGTLVESGQWVDQGDVIGLSGSTGVSTGPHLHFEIFFDPAWFVTGTRDISEVAQQIFGR